jgi:hypothetical protein
MSDNDWFDESDDCCDCADEGVVLDGPASLFRALIDAEPAPRDFSSALWRGLVPGSALDHRADTVASVPPKAS